MTGIFILFLFVSGQPNIELAKFEHIEQCRSERNVVQEEINRYKWVNPHIAVCTGEIKK